MYFQEAFEEMKKTLKKSKIKPTKDHFAIQVRITDNDCGGTFYIEQKNGEFYIEPYNYFDYDADIEVLFKNAKSIASGKTDIKNAIETGLVSVNGNVDAIIDYCKNLKTKPRAQKKSDSPKTSAKKIKSGSKASSKKDK